MVYNTPRSMIDWQKQSRCFALHLTVETDPFSKMLCLLASGMPHIGQSLKPLILSNINVVLL
jgi:hypothetical protein